MSSRIAKTRQRNSDLKNRKKKEEKKSKQVDNKLYALIKYLRSHLDKEFYLFKKKTDHSLLP